jgi:hypothetical protein
MQNELNIKKFVHFVHILLKFPFATFRDWPLILFSSFLLPFYILSTYICIWNFKLLSSSWE